MKSLVLLYFSCLFSLGYSQNRSDFFMEYKTIGLGSNDGYNSVIFVVRGTQLHINLKIVKPITEITSASDTLGKEYFLFSDSLWITEEMNISLRTSSIDSIEYFLKLPNGKRVNSNPCVKSGSVHFITITSDSIIPQSFRLYNSFDSTALQITDVLFTYLPKNTYDFRPLDMWKLSIQCDEALKKRQPQKNQDVSPATNTPPNPDKAKYMQNSLELEKKP